jgi:homoisocitrate dehydrogenase
MPRLCVIEGDGIGKEVVPAAVQVLAAAIPGLETVPAEAGWETFLKCGVSVPPETLDAIRACGAALFGAVQSPSRKVEGYRSAIISMRQALDLYANLRPVRSLPRISPRPDVDLVVVRENTEGLYSGREHWEGEDTAIAERVITRRASQRIGQTAAELLRAEGRKRLTVVHKANVLPLTDGLFRDVAVAAARAALDGYEGYEIEELLVDSAAYRMAAEPQRFEVIVTTNLFGDILSDEAAHWCGGMGLAASLNLGADVSLAEPVHGSAPDIAGKGIANPIAAVLSAALIARHAWQMEAAAQRIEAAVEAALAHDLPVDGGHLRAGLLTSEITAAILANL